MNCNPGKTAQSMMPYICIIKFNEYVAVPDIGHTGSLFATVQLFSKQFKSKNYSHG